MSSLILPRRFTSQPQGAVELSPDWADLILSASIGGTKYNTKTGTFDTHSGVGVSAAPNGVVDAPTGNAYVVENATLGSEFLILAAITPVSLTGIKQILSWDNSEITTKRYFQLRNNAANLEMVRFNDSVSSYTAATAVGIGIGQSGVVAGWSNGNLAGVLTPSGESGVTVTGGGKYVVAPAGEQLWFTRYRTTGGAIYEPTDNRFALRVVLRDPGSQDIRRLLRDNPWQLFRAPKRVLYFDVGGGGPNTDSAAGSGSIAVTGSTALATRTHLSSASSSSVAVTGSAANAVRTLLAAAQAGSISITGSAANGIYTSAGAYNADAQSGTISITGSAALGRHDYLAAAGSSSITITGSAASAVKSLGAVANSGSIAITGSNALAIRTWLASADAGSITLTGSGAVGVKATPGTGTLDPATITAIAEAVWDTELETGYTAREMMRIIFASLAGKRDGLGTATEYYYDVATGLVPRVIFTPDSNGNGTPIVDGS